MGRNEEGKLGAKRRHGTRVWAIALLMPLAAGACTVGATPSPELLAGASASAPVETAATTPEGTPTPIIEATATPSATPAATAEPTQLPTATPPATPMPTPKQPPADDTWTAIHWTAVPSGSAPDVPNVPEGYSGATAQGWSKGFVTLAWDARKRTLMPWTSADGTAWKAGPQVDTSPWAPEFQKRDAELAELMEGSDLSQMRESCTFDGQIVEGASSLLLRGAVACDQGCGPAWYTSVLAWTSTDGLTWKLVDLKNALGGDTIASISGGSSGFVGLGDAKHGRRVWTSHDGRTWKSSALPAEARALGSRPTDPVAFGNGFVLPAVVLQHKGPDFVAEPMEGGCVTTGDDTSRYGPALWWSADGASWTPVTLPGAASAASVWFSIQRVDDRTLLAYEDATTWSSDGNLSSEARITWLSTDGRTWRALSSFPDAGAYTLVEGHDRGLLCETVASTNASAMTPCRLRVFDRSHKLRTLLETGNVPRPDARQAMGPNRLLAYELDGSRFWIGIPSVG